MKKEPRAYRQSTRRVQAGLTRVLVLQAARDLLLGGSDAAGFTVDAVARQAGVARATVFNGFGGKPGLLQALFDEMSDRAGLMDVDALLGQPDAGQALADYVHAFGAFYEAERGLLRKLKAYAALDADFARLVAAREHKRTAGLLYLVQRLHGAAAKAAGADQRRTARRLQALLAFEVFEALAGSRRRLGSAAPDVLAMAHAIIGASP